MTHQSFDLHQATPIGAGAQVAHLRHVLALVEELADGARRGPAGYEQLEQAARISAAYERSAPIVRRRFDALAEETATWATAAIDALLAAQAAGEAPRAAAGQLARDLEAALGELATTVGG